MQIWIKEDEVKINSYFTGIFTEVNRGSLQSKANSLTVPIVEKRTDVVISCNVIRKKSLIK